MIRQTHFRAGGVLPEPATLAAAAPAPGDFEAPLYIDSRPYCLPASDQGFAPACAGFATAGFIEVQRWKETGRRQQLDGLAIYREAKKLDGIPDADGTYVSAAIEAAAALDLVRTPQLAELGRNRGQVKYALHRHDVAIGVFEICEAWNRADTVTGWIDSVPGLSQGRHAVLICWYDERGIGWQNSWAPDWGCNGFGRMTWAHFDRQWQYGVTFTEAN